MISNILYVGILWWFIYTCVYVCMYVYIYIYLFIYDFKLRLHDASLLALVKCRGYARTLFMQAE
jgi:hypothetical protein